MQTTAREIADRLNDYDATHNLLDHDIWNDVIRGLDEYDDEATDAADPNYESNVVVLTDGTRIELRENEWVIV